ncbi:MULTISPECIES: hypothetical protein [Stenotrophomonas]|uniref:hypothetical protein n=1 Tax=Stenotrophomonas TaxID=40323 RepID=UPI000C264444|nr:MULTISPECIES: hypothetical protein [Stenotrophomonas]MCF5090663.1 hypothetical protein [Stenotrophomonas sp. PA-6-5C]MCO7472469.1 hypothetical protein [Stenotrophomonas maltophilia]PJL17623.1 hypothetical protein B9Y66_02260 [Stenotrophomonas maltophilia]
MRTACVPLTADAERRLDTDSCLPGDLYEVMLSDTTVDLLFDSGFLTTLNTRFGLLFDRYEDESITRTEQLQYARALLRDLQLGRKCQSIDPLDIAFGLALEKMTGIYFYL